MSSLVNVIRVHPAEIQKFWPLAVGFINKSLDYQSDYDEVAVYRNLVVGEMLLWMVFEPQPTPESPAVIRAAVVTKFLQYPLTKVCLIFGLGGDGIHDWIHLLPEKIEPWAKAQGCNYIELRGREGWERMLGWAREAVVLRKEL